MADRDPRYNLSKIILAFNLAGISSYMMEILFDSRNVHSVSVGLILDLKVWMVVYTMCGVGYLSYWAAPTIAKTLIKMKISKKKGELNKRLKEICSEWGEEAIIEKVNALLTKKQ